MRNRPIFNPNKPSNIKRYVRSILTGSRDINNDSTGETLVYFRKKYKFSRNYIADKLGIGYYKYKEYEIGKKNCNFRSSVYFEKYCEITGIKKGDFIEQLQLILDKNIKKVFSYVGNHGAEIPFKK